jgi:hypothetical protein
MDTVDGEASRGSLREAASLGDAERIALIDSQTGNAGEHASDDASRPTAAAPPQAPAAAALLTAPVFPPSGHLRPQLQPGLMNPALQRTDGAAGHTRRFLVASFFDPNQMKGLLLVLRGALESKGQLTQFGPAVLRGRCAYLRHLIEIVVLAPSAHTGNEVIDRDPGHPSAISLA